MSLLRWSQWAARREPRFPIRLEVEFGSRTSFLVAYSVNLSRGGLFLATGEVLPPGARLTLRLVVPGYTPLIEAEVAWTRTREEGSPGMGIRFLEHSRDELGLIIDDIMASFRGARVLLFAARPASRTELGRLLRSVMRSAHVVEASTGRELDALRQRQPELDLGVVEADRAGMAALRLLRRQAAERGGRLPVIALARDDLDRARAEELGVGRVLTSPPPFQELQDAVIGVLGTPTRVSD